MTDSPKLPPSPGSPENIPMNLKGHATTLGMTKSQNLASEYAKFVEETYKSAEINPNLTTDSANKVLLTFIFCWAALMEAALESRIEKLESEALRYCGIWDATTNYPSGSGVTYAGSLWRARGQNVGQRPEESHGSWQLIVKRGRDAK